MNTEEMDSGVESLTVSGHESPNTTSAITDRGDEEITEQIDTTIEDEINPDESVENVVNDVGDSAIGVFTPSADVQSSATLIPPETSTTNASINEDNDDDEDIDETMFERLYGLTEMFPESVRNGVYSLSYHAMSGAKWFYGFSRSALWIVFSSSTLLVAPVVFELERSQVHKQMQRQMLLGPNPGMMGMMGMPPPPSPPPPQR